MLKANTGSSINKGAQAAGREAAMKTKAGLEKIKMAFAYASCTYDLDAMLKGIAEELPNVPIIGNTSFTGVILPEGLVSSEDGFLGMMALEDDDLDVGIAAAVKGNCAVEAGKKVSSTLQLPLPPQS